jgi:hypothetical protein
VWDKSEATISAQALDGTVRWVRSCEYVCAV